MVEKLHGEYKTHLMWLWSLSKLQYLRFQTNQQIEFKMIIFPTLKLGEDSSKTDLSKFHVYFREPKIS